MQKSETRNQNSETIPADTERETAKDAKSAKTGED
jgi:hypothetical protein